MPLRASSLRPPNAVSRGRPVQVFTQGEGFTVSGEGQALNDAAPGERVRVRLANGQIVQGIAREDGTVTLRF
jgi:flagella basal body P-ring formation protein FlgA